MDEFNVAYILIGEDQMPRPAPENIQAHYYCYPEDINWDELRQEIEDLAPFYAGIIIQHDGPHIDNLVPHDKDVGGYNWGYGFEPAEAIAAKEIFKIETETATITCSVENKKELNVNDIIMKNLMKGREEK